MFKHGRTETLRAFSRESRHWVLSMLDPLDSVSSASYLIIFCKLALKISLFLSLYSIQQTHRFRLLHQATGISSHCLRTHEAMTGRGIELPFEIKYKWAASERWAVV
jgi:hypothetical protein